MRRRTFRRTNPEGLIAAAVLGPLSGYATLYLLQRTGLLSETWQRAGASYAASVLTGAVMGGFGGMIVAPASLFAIDMFALPMAQQALSGQRITVLGT